jgi:hypothetical protein
LPTLPQPPIFDEFIEPEDISIHLQTIWNNQNSLNHALSSMVANRADLAETYFEKYSNPIFKKVIAIDNINSHKYDQKFHNDGNIATMNATWLTGAYVFFINDFYDYEPLDHFVLVFDNFTGELIPQKDIVLHKSVGGARLFIRWNNAYVPLKKNFIEGNSISIVVFRKMIYSTTPLYAKHTLGTGISVGNSVQYNFVIQDATETVGLLTSSNDYYVVAKTQTGSWIKFQKSEYSIQVDQGGNRLLVSMFPLSYATNLTFYVVNKNNAAEISFDYVSMECAINVNEVNYSNGLTLSSNGVVESKIFASDPYKFIELYFHDKVMNERIPVIFDENDLNHTFVFFNGVKLSPGTQEFYFDRTLNLFAILNSAFPSGEELKWMRIIFNGISPNVGIYKTMYDLNDGSTALSCQYLPNVIFHSQETISHVIRKKALFFVNNHYIEATPEVITDNDFHVPEIDSQSNVELYSFFFRDAVTQAFLDDFNNRTTEIQRYLQLNGVNNTLIQNWIDANSGSIGIFEDVDFRQTGWFGNSYNYYEPLSKGFTDLFNIETEATVENNVSMTKITSIHSNAGVSSDLLVTPDESSFVAGDKYSTTAFILDSNVTSEACSCLLFDMMT